MFERLIYWLMEWYWAVFTPDDSEAIATARTQLINQWEKENANDSNQD